MSGIVITRSVPSRKSTELDLADLLVNGKLQIYPHVEEKGLLFLQFRNDKVIVSAGPYIGLIPLTPSVSIEVEPKLPVSNLARVLDTARSSLTALSGTDRLYLASEASSNSILEFLGANLVDALKTIEENGFHKEYLPVIEKTSYPSGKLLYSETLLKCWSRGEYHRVRAQKFVHTANTPHNRTLKSALRILLSRLDPGSEGARHLIKVANQAFARFPDIVKEMTGRDMCVCQATIETRSLPATKSYYYRALDIASLILSNKSVALQSVGSDIILNTFIINFEVLFEEYLRRILSAHRPNSVSVQDGNKEGKRSLFDDKRDPPAQPDIVLQSTPDGTQIVGEVKYKDKPNREDINQAITYALCYRTQKAILIYQSSPRKKSGPTIIGEINGITLKGYAFNLENEDLDQEEENFATFMFQELAS
ncbi:McrC family protein [Phaeobacter sp. G2]|nr:McrC family protein [Phaeobacter sp. G2]